MHTSRTVDYVTRPQRASDALACPRLPRAATRLESAATKRATELQREEAPRAVGCLFKGRAGILDATQT